MTKCREGIPSVQLDRNPRILEYDSAGTDDGVRIVTLVQGFAFEDVAARTEDDPDGRQALHSRGFENVHTALLGSQGRRSLSVWALRRTGPPRLAPSDRPSDEDVQQGLPVPVSVEDEHGRGGEDAPVADGRGIPALMQVEPGDRRPETRASCVLHPRRHEDPAPGPHPTEDPPDLRRPQRHDRGLRVDMLVLDPELGPVPAAIAVRRPGAHHA